MSSEVSFDLSGKVMIVTGAGKGIGKSIAETASHYGASLALGSRTVSECEEAAEICRAQGVQAEAWQLDVTCLDSIDRFVAQTWDTFGRIDSVVNNAGNNIPKPALDYTEEEFDSMSAVNFKGPFFMSTSCARRMIEAGIEGSIISISSQVGVVGGPLRSIYASAKGAVGQMTPVAGGGVGAARHHGQRRRADLHAHAPVGASDPEPGLRQEPGEDPDGAYRRAARNCRRCHLHGLGRGQDGNRADSAGRWWLYSGLDQRPQPASNIASFESSLHWFDRNRLCPPNCE